MPLKKSTGNMYDWCGFTHSHLGGQCPHLCSYCYVTSVRFGRPARYQGPLRLLEEEFKVKYGEGRTIFLEHCNDLFAEAVDSSFIDRVLAHARAWPKNTYVFQSKNPARFMGWLKEIPLGSILGTTIESNRWHSAMGSSPSPAVRHNAMVDLRGHGFRTFLTIEPVMAFDAEVLAQWVADIGPNFLNIGADSKGHGLVEPNGADVRALVAELAKRGVEVREKHNLGRLLGAT